MHYIKKYEEKNFQYFSHLAELSRRSLFLKRKNWKFSDRETRLYNHTYLIGETKNKKNKQNTLQFFYHLVNFLDRKILKKINFEAILPIKNFIT